MTSPVDTSVKWFWSGMANVPKLDGTAGSLIGVLDACLVTGCDIKPLTGLTLKGGIATAAFAGQHSARADTVILVEGVTGELAALNGEQKVVARPTVSTLTFATDLPDGSAQGNITIKLAPAGWSKPFNGTNKAVYTSTDPQSLGMFLRVDDAARNVRVRGFETMSDVDTGTGLFPTDSMVSGGGYWNKSSKADTTAVPWLLAADGRFMMLWCAPYLPTDANANMGCTWGFGDLISHKPGGDAYAAMLSCDSQADMALSGIDCGVDVRTVLARGYAGLGGPLWNGSYPYTGSGGSVSGADPNPLGAFPNAITGELHLSRRYIAASGANNPPRADVPGIWTVPQSGLTSYFATGNTVAGAGLIKGRNLVAIKVCRSSSWNQNNGTSGIAFIDITGPWR